MITKSKKSDTARLETRLPKEQKMLFKRAARLGGYGSLSDFVLTSAREKADKIIAENRKVLASKRDSEIFFDAITNPPKPNAALNKAVKNYNSLISE